MAAPSRTQLLTDVHSHLKRRYKPGPRPERLSVLEAVIYGICHEGTTREQANQAISRFKDEFFDWNEVRVSSVDEIQGVLAGLPDPEGRAQRLRRFLRQLFEKTYGFDLNALAKKPLKEAVKSLHEYEALQSDFVLATVIQQALGGHAIPVDASLHRALGRLHAADAGTDDASLRATLERAVPKNRGAEFGDLIEELAHDTCVEGVPDCPRCELKKICPTGQARLVADKEAVKAEAKAAREAVRAAAVAEKSRAKAKAAKAKPAPAAKAAPPAKTPRKSHAPVKAASRGGPAKTAKAKSPRAR